MELSFVNHVGVSIEEQRDGRSRCTLLVEDHHFNSAGIVHGGALFTLADTAMGAALYPTLAPGEGCATIEVKISYFKPVVAGAVVCAGKIVNRGRTVASLEACLHAGEVLVAKANGTFAVFQRKSERSAHAQPSQ
jgi:acyl-CoA thioesterase